MNNCLLKSSSKMTGTYLSEGWCCLRQNYLWYWSLVLKTQYTIFLYSPVTPQGVKSISKKFNFLLFKFFFFLKLSCQEWKIPWQSWPVKLCICTAEHYRANSIVKFGSDPYVLKVECPQLIWKFTYLNYPSNLLQFDL